MLKFNTLVNSERDFEVFDATGKLLAMGKLSRSNPQKLAKFLMGQHPTATKVKITTHYQKDRHPRGLTHETRTFVKK